MSFGLRLLSSGLRLATLLIAVTGQTLPAATHVVTVNLDGSFSPTRVEILSGETVEWHLADRTDTIIPVNLNAAGQPDCTLPRPYDPKDPNEFTGPMPRAVSGIFSLSDEELPYATLDETWQNPNITGVFIRPRWDDVHLGPGKFVTVHASG